MNVDQRQLFILITESIKNQLNGDTKQEKIFVSGGAGTGKTFLFNLLKNQVNRCYSKPVVKVGALTGVAARLIGGSTLHRMLKLPVQKEGGVSPTITEDIQSVRIDFGPDSVHMIKPISIQFPTTYIYGTA
ncbi:hypothetical protein J6590_066778 [Homalodisca vitripennis]|nr:hypothetical protein J6590_066778 [Homalodisca vitripennis]